MNAHVTFHHGIGLPPVKDMVQSLSDSATQALANRDTRGATPTQRQAARSNENPVGSSPTVWMRPLSAAPASRFGKSGAFAVVVLVHALAAYALTHLPSQVKDIVMQPLQVAIVAMPQSADEKPLPPPTMQQQNISLPVEPVFLIAAEPAVTAISVQSQPVETTTTSYATVAPKVVSTVEYIREPQPKYPPAARALKQRGTVLLRVLVDAEGHAQEVSLHRTSGHRALDDAARTAVLNALFKPYTENGQTLPVYVFVPIEFGAA